ncbi:hypothetical protein SAMN05192543_11721 [Paraburkholderia megapolitana]|uniref:Uncharacterized protein n=1 Tax=Paraburkholderia megapolitana TaxID=420953 RepID=A0A1I3W968_9BURK|nr:hypothetical protein SAMN05192543_11721 [Paraburkholderia megapolitana]
MASSFLRTGLMDCAFTHQFVGVILRDYARRIWVESS